MAPSGTVMKVDDIETTMSNLEPTLTNLNLLCSVHYSIGRVRWETYCSKWEIYCPICQLPLPIAGVCGASISRPRRVVAGHCQGRRAWSASATGARRHGC